MHNKLKRVFGVFRFTQYLENDLMYLVLVACASVRRAVQIGSTYVESVDKS